MAIPFMIRGRWEPLHGLSQESQEFLLALLPEEWAAAQERAGTLYFDVNACLEALKELVEDSEATEEDREKARMVQKELEALAEEYKDLLFLVL